MEEKKPMVDMFWSRVITIARSMRAYSSLSPGMFWSMAITIAVIYLLISLGIPAISRWVTGLELPLPVPGTLKIFYMALVLMAIFIYVTSDDGELDEFLRPIVNLLKGGYGSRTKIVVLIVLPLIFAGSVYSYTAPKISSPTALRVQHPSSNFPKQFETMQNPLRTPPDTDVDKFIEQAKTNAVEFIEQVRPEVERWKKQNPNSHILNFIPTEPMKTFLKDLKGGNVEKNRARSALIEKYLFEGRALYAMNCRPCHGDSVAGDGPMADGFKLRPINFTDNGTIETIVEGYTFWRVSTGGRGLPAEATPWDSVMPTWDTDLTEAERWRIILAEYDLAQKMPRQPEKVEEAKK